jgi:DNA-binding MarR family transcriptional regulator
MSSDIQRAVDRSRPTSARRRRQLVAQDVERLPGHLIRVVQQAHKRMWANVVSTEITSPQYGILNVILAHQGIDQKTAGEEVGIDKSTVGDVVDRLIGKRLVRAFRDPDDQRRNLLYLSEAGQDVLAELAPRVLEMNCKLVAALDESEQEVLVGLLERIVESLPENGS